VHALAREAARRTGRTQTGVIEAALERYLAQAPASDASDPDRRLDEILADVRVRLQAADAGALDTEALYDESGLPR